MHGLIRDPPTESVQEPQSPLRSYDGVALRENQVLAYHPAVEISATSLIFDYSLLATILGFNPQR